MVAHMYPETLFKSQTLPRTHPQMRLVTPVVTGSASLHTMRMLQIVTIWFSCCMRSLSG